MPFKKGDPNINRQGRKKGVANRTTEELRGMIKDFLEKNIEVLQADFDKLDPKERLNFIDKMLVHVMPKPITRLDQLSEDDLKALLGLVESEQIVITRDEAKQISKALDDEY